MTNQRMGSAHLSGRVVKAAMSHSFVRAMEATLLDEDHILAVEADILVLRSLRSIPIHTLVLDAFNKTKAEELHLAIGDMFRWDMETEEALREDFDDVLFDMLRQDELLFDPENGLTNRVKLMACCKA